MSNADRRCPACDGRLIEVEARLSRLRSDHRYTSYSTQEVLYEVDMPYLLAELHTTRRQIERVRQRCEKAWSMVQEEPGSQILQGAAVLGTLIVYVLDGPDSASVHPQDLVPTEVAAPALDVTERGSER